MRLLIIRRDNIGDLVCTTPLLRALRRQLPDAQIEVLATRYNAAVLHGNPDINALHFYVKAKHREIGESLFPVYWNRLRMLFGLCRRHFDIALLPGEPNPHALSLARWIRPARIVQQGAVSHTHEVERCCTLLTQIGLEYETPAPRVVANQDKVASVATSLPAGTPRIGIHISARKPSQRWPIGHFAKLIQLLHEQIPSAQLLLLWSPGSSDNPLHPGDDEKAEAILAACIGLPVTPIPTLELDTLVAAISLCDTFICADGGAMHLAAGLGKPIVALFGKSSPERWRPWGVPQRVLQHASQEVSAITVDEVLGAYTDIANQPDRTS